MIKPRVLFLAILEKKGITKRKAKVDSAEPGLRLPNFSRTDCTPTIPPTPILYWTLSSSKY